MNALLALLVACASTLANPGEPPMDYGNLVEQGGVVFAWRIEDGVLHGMMEAPTTGWVAVGFNDVPQLRGTRLIMGAIDGRVVVEEHRALVPDHVRTAIVPGATGSEQGGRSTLVFAIPLDPGRPGEVVLKPGMSVHLTLAYSRSDDFFHHSSMRTAVGVTL